MKKRWPGSDPAAATRLVGPGAGAGLVAAAFKAAQAPISPNSTSNR
jgi:hypothetical protein